MNPCTHYNDGRCDNPVCKWFGKTVGDGVCMNHCVSYSGPERTPKLIAKVLGVTVNGKPVKAKSRGLGDTVAKMTSAVGIKPCGGCKKRQEALNKKFPYKSV